MLHNMLLSDTSLNFIRTMLQIYCTAIINIVRTFPVDICKSYMCLFYSEGHFADKSYSVLFFYRKTIRWRFHISVIVLKNIDWKWPLWTAAFLLTVECWYSIWFVILGFENIVWCACSKLTFPVCDIQLLIKIVIWVWWWIVQSIFWSRLPTRRSKL